MLLQDEVVQYALVSEGQLFVDPKDIRLDTEKIRDYIFIPTVREYERYRPPTKVTEYWMSGNAQTLPADCRKVIKLRPTP